MKSSLFVLITLFGLDRLSHSQYAIPLRKSSVHRRITYDDELEGSAPAFKIKDEMATATEWKCTIENRCVADVWPWYDEVKRKLPSMDFLLANAINAVPNLYYQWCYL